MQNLPANIDKSLRVVACPHPFKIANQEYSFAPTISVAQVLREVQPDPFLRRRAHVWVNDNRLSPDKWETTYPEANSKIDIRVVPSGGVGRIIGTIFIAIAAIVASVLTWYLAPASWPAIWTGALAGIAAMGVGIVGNLILNALIPPTGSKSSGALSALSPMAGIGGVDYGQTSPTLAITGASNKENLYGPIPKMLGRHKVSPPYGARTYTESAGADQYLRLLFVWGFGAVQVEDLRIGQTPLSNFQGVEIEHRNLTIYLTAQTIAINVIGKTLTRSSGIWSMEGIKVGDTITLGGCTTSANNTTYLISIVTDLVLTYTTGTATTTETGNGAQTVTVVYDNDPITLYPTSIHEEALQVQLLTDIPNISTSENDIDEISVDVICPNGLCGITSDGTYTTLNCNITVTYRETGTSGVWLTPDGTDGDGNTATTIALTGSSKSAVRGNLRWKVVRGQYDVKLNRTSPADTVWTQSISYWVALRSITNEDPLVDLPYWLNPATDVYESRLLAKTAMRIKATGQLNGTVDEFNGITTTICPDWDAGTSTWITRTTQNPASLYREAAQGNHCQKPLPNNRLDLTRLQYWHTYCVTNSWKYNKNIDYVTSIKELLDEIAASGRAAFAWIDSKLGIIIDEVQAFTIGPIFNPRNIIKDSFQSSLVYPDLPHAFRIPFPNEDQEYQQDERVVLDDGYLIDNLDAWGVTKVIGDPFSATQNYAAATIFEQLELPGVTDPELIFKHARYHIAAARLRPETIEFSTDLEWLVATRGDRFKFAHDTMLVGLSWGRVKSLVMEIGSYELVPDYPPAQSDTYVKATSKYSTSFWPYFATDPSKSLVGSSSSNAWLSASGNTSQQCVHVDLGVEKLITGILYENYHNSGADTTAGAKNFTLWGSNDPTAFADTTWANDTGWTQVYSGQFIKHVVANQADPQTIPITNSTSYRYWRTKIADNWTNVTAMGLRRLVLQEDGDPIYTGALGGVTTDEILPMEVGTNYVLRFRTSNNTTILAPIETVAGELKTATFTTPIPAVDDWPAIGDLFLFGETALEAIDLIVKSIQPNSDLSAKVTAVEYNPAIYTADTGSIPAHSSNITVPSAWWTPVVSDVRSDGTALLRSADGSWISRILLTLTRPSGLNSQITRVETQYWVTGSGEPPTVLPVVDLDVGEVSILPVEDGRSYDYQLRYVKIDDSRGTWTTAATHVVEGKTAPPEDVIGFSVSQVKEVINFTWTQNPDLDIAGYEIRYTVPSGSWESATPITEIIRSTSFATPMLPPNQLDMLIKAVDTSGNYSLNATRKLFKVVQFYNTLYNTGNFPSWIGTKTNFILNPLTGNLNPDDQYLANDVTYESGFELFDSYVADPYTTSTYESPEIDMGVDITGRAWGRIYSNLGPGEGGTNDPVMWLDYCLAADYISPGYDGFEEWIIGSVSGRYFKFKVIITAATGLCRLTEFQPVLDKTY